jgi:transposase
MGACSPWQRHLRSWSTHSARSWEAVSRLHTRALTETERATLERWRRSDSRILYLRARAILLAADQQQSGAEVARTLGVLENTARRWLHAFAAGGLDALLPRPRGTRTKRVDDDLAEWIIQLLQQSPAAYGFGLGRWTLRDVATTLIKEDRVQQISPRAVARLLRARNYAWKRGTHQQQFSDSVGDALLELLEDAPAAHGCAAGRWTQRDLAAVLMREGHVKQISQGSVRRILQARGYPWPPATREGQHAPDLADTCIALLRQSPRSYGLPYSRWRLIELATVLVREGHVARISPQTISKHLRARNVAYPWRKGGSYRRFGAATLDAITRLLHEDPRMHGFAQGIWSLEHLAVALVREGYVARISPQTIRRLLRTRNISWEQARQWVYRPHRRIVRLPMQAARSRAL